MCASIQAVVTLLHFPLLLFLAYGADRKWNFSGEENKVQPHLTMMQSTVRLLPLAVTSRLPSSQICVYFSANPQFVNRIHALTYARPIWRTSLCRVHTSRPLECGG
jgi:hypothetical protein